MLVDVGEPDEGGLDPTGEKVQHQPVADLQ
jgi:hypothetical protein